MKIITVFNSNDFNPNFGMCKDRYLPVYPSIKTASLDLAAPIGALGLPGLITEQEILIIDASSDKENVITPKLKDFCEFLRVKYDTYANVAYELRRFLGDEIFDKRYSSVISDTNNESEGGEG